MAATKKSKPKKPEDMALSVGDCVSVISATIFDKSGKLSDLLATGTITQINPLPGWDYEVTFIGELSLDGREKIKSRSYNRHQITKSLTGSTPAMMADGLFDMLGREHNAIRNYNSIVERIAEISSRMTASSVPAHIEKLGSERLIYLEKLPELEQKVKEARKQIADAIHSLLAEYSDDKTAVSREVPV